MDALGQMARKLVRWATAAALVAALMAPASALADSPTVEAYQTSWTHRALGLQYRLSSDMPFRNLPWVGTHNSYNSRAEMGPTLSDTDSNQIVDIVDQLDLDIRKLEIDIHWFPSVQGGGFAPVVCHARGGDQAHFGCTIEKTLAVVLDEIRGWLNQPGKREQVLLLYIEPHLDDLEGHDVQEGYDAAAAVVEQKLGDVLHKPAGEGCQNLPLDLTRKTIRQAGRQVIIVTDSCGVGTAWPAVAHNWVPVRLQKRIEKDKPYSDFPTCGVDWTREQYDQSLIRYWHDVTFIGSTPQPDPGIPAETAAQMARCGVDVIDLDNIVPDDGRLDALVWGWAENQPAGRRCAVQRVGAQSPFGRWYTKPCGTLRRPACREGGLWFVPTGYVAQAAATARCQSAAGRFAVPRTGHEAQLLRLAMADAGVGQVWLGYRRFGNRWTALDSRAP